MGDTMSQAQKKMSVPLSVIAPAFNEAENLPQLVKEVYEALAQFTGDWEFLIVNDGSTDETPDVLQGLVPVHAELCVLSLAHRSGQTAALDAGLSAAQGDCIALLDADLQNDPQDILRLLDMVVSGQCDMVNGWRQTRHDNWLRLVSSRIGNGVRNWLTHEDIHDTGCGLKVFRQECLTGVKLFTGMHRFLPTLAKMEGFRVIEVPVHHRPRLAGQAKYGIGNRAWCGLCDIMAIRWMKQRKLHYHLGADT
jgi:dolichol-phosphate mannosyltransferase